MRFILVILFLIIFTIISIPMFLIGLIIGFKSKEMRHRFSQPFVMLGFKGIMLISGVKLTVKGEENIIRDGSALYVFNHRGFFDIICGYPTGPRQTAFVSKKEIGRIPMIGQWMVYMQCLFLDRKDMKQGLEVINKGIELLKNGTSVYIAPEGTRNKGEGVQEFHAASFRLAIKSGRPIVPVVINNTDNIWENHMPWIYKGHVIIEYCQPIYLDDMDRAEKKKIHEKVREIILEKYLENEKEV